MNLFADLRFRTLQVDRVRESVGVGGIVGERFQHHELSVAQEADGVRFVDLEEDALVLPEGKEVLLSRLDVKRANLHLPVREIEEDPRTPVEVIAEHRPRLHPVSYTHLTLPTIYSV